MQYNNSVAIVRTKKGNTVGCHMISTRNYQRICPNQFSYTSFKGYVCESFEIFENVGGQVKVKTMDKLIHSKIDFENVITISNVTDIEIMSEHDV